MIFYFGWTFFGVNISTWYWQNKRKIESVYQRTFSSELRARLCLFVEWKHRAVNGKSCVNNESIKLQLQWPNRLISGICLFLGAMGLISDSRWNCCCEHSWILDDADQWYNIISVTISDLIINLFSLFTRPHMDTFTLSLSVFRV